jgi:hypothetical protein
MDNLVERIAHHADMDTRRAMGFPPRKLPPSDLNIKLNFVPHGWGRKIHLGDGVILSLTVHPRGGISWVFGGPRLTTVTEYFFTREGRLRVWTLCRYEDSLHPDFNEDGTLKSWRTV